MRSRVLGVVTLLLLAPISAELLSAYLGDLGGVVGIAFAIAFFAPLYGGAALLIRELSVRTGRGWACRYLLAAAFGVAMTTVIDGSLFTPVRDDVDDWADIMAAAPIMGISAYALVTWVFGHILMSVAAPVAVAEGLARTGGPWLSRTALAVVTVLFVLWAGLVHADQWSEATVDLTWTRTVISVAVIVILVVAAFAPPFVPRSPRDRVVPPVWVCAVVGFVGLAALDFSPLSWAGVAQTLGAVVLVGALSAFWSRSPRWTLRHTAFLAYGALLARAGTGFLAPVPQGSSVAEKVGQNVTYLVLLALLGVALVRRTRPESQAG